MVARPLGERYPLEQRVAEFESRSIAQRGQAGTPMASDVSGVAPKRMSLDEKTKVDGEFHRPAPAWCRRSPLWPPWCCRPPAIHTSAGRSAARIHDQRFRHHIRQAGTADRAEITRDIASMPREQRTGEIQQTLYNWIERKDINAMTPEDRAVLTDPAQSQHLLGAATPLGWMRQELRNIYNRMRNLGFPDDELVNPDYMHRRAVGHIPVVILHLAPARLM
jgi:hypothetical protein